MFPLEKTKYDMIFSNILILSVLLVRLIIQKYYKYTLQLQ